MKALKEIVGSSAVWVSIAVWGLAAFLLSHGTTLPLWGCVLAGLGVVIVAWLFVGWIFGEYTV